MEILHRKIISKKEEVQKTLRVGLIDGMRLSISINEKDDKEKKELVERNDVVINFTKEETEKIKGVLKWKN